MAYYEGSDMRIKIGTNNVFHETDATLNWSREFKEIASKDTDGVESSPGKKSWSLTSSAYVINTPDTQNDLKSIAEAGDLGTLVDVQFTDGKSGNLVFSGQAYIENFSVKATTDDTVTFDYSLKGNGSLTIGQNA
ncbi:phage tail tube protein [Winogradskyella sp.]|uniref:phage tail tube protein n=1 Tax=Winogradskyella sp. TaxID=1883156 RepID=UPI003AB72CD9